MAFDPQTHGRYTDRRPMNKTSKDSGASIQSNKVLLRTLASFVNVGNGKQMVDNACGRKPLLGQRFAQDFFLPASVFLSD